MSEEMLNLLYKSIRDLEIDCNKQIKQFTDKELISYIDGRRSAYETVLGLIDFAKGENHVLPDL